VSSISANLGAIILQGPLLQSYLEGAHKNKMNALIPKEMEHAVLVSGDLRLSGSRGNSLNCALESHNFLEFFEAINGSDHDE
jgi:hypothetical protein